MKRVLIIFVVIIGIAVAALVGYILTLDINDYKDQLVALVEDETGRDFTIAGDIDLKVSMALIPTVSMEGVRFGNASWGTAENMLSVERFEARVALLPLLSGTVDIKRLALTGAIFSLEKNAAGEANWVMGTGKPAAADASPSELPALALKEVEIRDAVLRYADAGSDTQQEFKIATIMLQRAGRQLAVTIEADYNTAPVRLSGTIGALKTLTQNKPYDIDLNGEIGGLTLALKGSIQNPQQATGIDMTLEIAADTLAQIGELAETELPPVGPVSLSAKVSDESGGYQLNALKVQLGSSDLAGAASLELSGERPSLRAKLESGVLNLAELSGAPVEEEKKDRVFSPEPLALDALKIVDANVTIAAKLIKTANMDLIDVNTKVVLAGGKLTIDPLNAGVAGGKFSGRITLDASGKRASLNQDVRIVGLIPSQLPQLKDKNTLTGGKTDITIVLRGTGASVAEIMGSANGKLLVIMGEGQLSNEGTDVATGDMLFKAMRMLNPMSSQDETTKVECAVINFPIKDGIAENESGFALQTAKLNILGGGSVDLKTEKLDIGAKPKPREGVGLNLASFADFVRLGGTLANPTPVTDAKGAATAGIKVGAAVATGGLSLLAEGLFDRATVDEEVCAVALGQKPAASKTQTAQTTPESTAEGKPTGVIDGAGDVVKGAGEAVKGIFKGLFGN